MFVLNKMGEGFTLSALADRGSYSGVAVDLFC